MTSGLGWLARSRPASLSKRSLSLALVDAVVLNPSPSTASSRPSTPRRPAPGTAHALRLARRPGCTKPFPATRCSAAVQLSWRRVDHDPAATRRPIASPGGSHSRRQVDPDHGAAKGEGCRPTRFGRPALNSPARARIRQHGCERQTRDCATTAATRRPRVDGRRQFRRSARVRSSHLG